MINNNIIQANYNIFESNNLFEDYKNKISNNVNDSDNDIDSNKKEL